MIVIRILCLTSTVLVLSMDCQAHNRGKDFGVSFGGSVLGSAVGSAIGTAVGNAISTPSPRHGNVVVVHEAHEPSIRLCKLKRMERRIRVELDELKTLRHSFKRKLDNIEEKIEEKERALRHILTEMELD